MKANASIIDKSFHASRAKLRAHLEKAWGFCVLSKDAKGPLVVQTGLGEPVIWERREGEKSDWWFERVQVGQES